MTNKSQSKSTEPTYRLRPSVEKDGPMSASFALNNIESFLYLHTDGTLAVHKRLKNGEPGAKPIAKGSVRLFRSKTENAPQLRGSLKTSAGSTFDLSFWYHDEEKDPYYTVRYSARLIRKGKCFLPSQFAG